MIKLEHVLALSPELLHPLPPEDILLMRAEAQARNLLVYDPNHVPDLLQTDAYARAMASMAGTELAEVRYGLLPARQELARQRVHDGQLRIAAFTGENALRNTLGMRPDDMRDQLDRLISFLPNDREDEKDMRTRFRAIPPGQAQDTTEAITLIKYDQSGGLAYMAAAEGDRAGVSANEQDLLLGAEYFRHEIMTGAANDPETTRALIRKHLSFIGASLPDIETYSSGVAHPIDRGDDS